MVNHVQKVDKKAKRFVDAVVAYIEGVHDPVRRISVLQAASMAGCAESTMHQHLKKINAPMAKHTDPRKLFGRYEKPRDMWRPKL